MRNSGETHDSENILHFKMITGPDGITGLSPIEQCKNAIGWGMDVQEYSSTFFKNGGKLSPEYWNQIEHCRNRP